MEAVLVAFFGSLTSLFAWRASIHSKGARDDMQTNHGKRPGEYLEMIADVRTDLASHTLQDAENFQSLAEALSKHVSRRPLRKGDR